MGGDITLHGHLPKALILIEFEERIRNKK